MPLQAERSVGEVAPEQHYLFFLNETLPVSYKDIAAESQKDNLLCSIYGYVMFEWPDKCKENEKPFYVRRSELYIDPGRILYKYRLVIPVTLRKQVLLEIHEGHLGVIKMKSIARNYVYWPTLDKDIESVGLNCNACQGVRDLPPRTTLHPWDFPTATWKRLHADFAQLYGKYYIIVVDAYSKWLEAEEIRSTSAFHTIKFFRNLFSKFGLPEKLVTDNGPPFRSKEFLDFCENNIIKHITSSPYRPQGNGAAENSVKIIKKTIKKAVTEGEDIHTSLCRFLLQYRNCQHATTGVAPAVALLGRCLRNRLDAMRPSTSRIVEEIQSKQIENSGGVVRDLKIGDNVLTRGYSTNSNKWVEGKIIEQTGPVSYKIDTNDGHIFRRHTDQILPKRNSRFSWETGNESETEIAEEQGNDNFVNTRPRKRRDDFRESLSDYEDADETPTQERSTKIVEPSVCEPTTAPSSPIQDKRQVAGSQHSVPDSLTECIDRRAKRALIRECRKKILESKE